MKKRIALVALLVGGIAIAQVTQLDLNVSSRIMAITGGLLVVPARLIGSNSNIEANRITRSLGAVTTIDFTYDAGCQTATIGLPGARATDACALGVQLPAANSAYMCWASDAGEVSIRQCPAGADPASSTYSVRLTSSQP